MEDENQVSEDVEALLLMARRIRPNIIVITILALLSLALGYWGRWIAHPAAGLNILGVDLPEYVKFVPEARYGVIPINRLVFFGPPVALSLGLILFASMRVRLSFWLRGLAGLLAIPVALSMLPPAWTPGLLMTPEFRTQTLVIMALSAAVLLIPLWKALLPDWLRGGFFILLGLLPLPALSAFYKIAPALEKLYDHPLKPGPGVYWLMIGMALLMIAGVLLMRLSLVGRQQAAQAHLPASAE